MTACWVTSRGCFDLAEETKAQIEAELEDIFRDKSYPVRGSSEEERRQYSMQDSRVVLGALDRLHREILLMRIEEYESGTNYGEDGPGAGQVRPKVCPDETIQVRSGLERPRPSRWQPWPQGLLPEP